MEFDGLGLILLCIVFDFDMFWQTCASGSIVPIGTAQISDLSPFDGQPKEAAEVRLTSKLSVALDWLQIKLSTVPRFDDIFKNRTIQRQERLVNDSSRQCSAVSNILKTVFNVSGTCILRPCFFLQSCVLANGAAESGRGEESQ